MDGLMGLSGMTGLTGQTEKIQKKIERVSAKVIGVFRGRGCASPLDALNFVKRSRKGRKTYKIRDPPPPPPPSERIPGKSKTYKF